MPTRLPCRPGPKSGPRSSPADREEGLLGALRPSAGRAESGVHLERAQHVALRDPSRKRETAPFPRKSPSGVTAHATPRPDPAEDCREASRPYGDPGQIVRRRRHVGFDEIEWSAHARVELARDMPVCTERGGCLSTPRLEGHASNVISECAAISANTKKILWNNTAGRSPQRRVRLDRRCRSPCPPSRSNRGRHARGAVGAQREPPVAVGLLILGGRLGDLFGRRRIFVIGAVGFSVASAVGG